MSVGERGSAIVTTLVLLACVLAAGAGVLSVALTERQMAANFEAGARTASAAEAMAAYAVAALANDGVWDLALADGGQAPFREPSPVVSASWNATLDLSAATATLQQQTNSRWGAGFDTPRWNLFAWGPLHGLVAADPAGATPYLVAWVADNASDGDGNPLADHDGVLVVRAEARLGTRQSRVEVFVRRDPPDSSVTADDRNVPAGSTDPQESDLAQNLRPANRDAATLENARVRVVSWREVP